MPDGIQYPNGTIPSLRFRYCPMCREGLSWAVPFDDEIRRPRCGGCGWIHGPRNALGVITVVRRGNSILVIRPPGEDGVALPAGLVEYGETPEQAATREVLEETGVHTEIVRALGWEYVASSEWPGPQVLFMFEATASGEAPSGSQEGRAVFIPLESAPKAISASRRGSQLAIRTFLDVTEV